MNALFQTILVFISCMIFLAKCNDVNLATTNVIDVSTTSVIDVSTTSVIDASTTGVIDFSTSNAPNQHQHNIPKWLSNIVNHFSLTIWIVILVSFAVCVLCCLAATCYCCRKRRQPSFNSINNSYLYYNNV